LIAGSAVVSHTSRAVVWHDETAVYLGRFANGGFSVGDGVNDAGVVVGSAQPTRLCQCFHAVFWGGAGKIHDLGTLRGDVSSEATAINESGEIVGSSINAEDVVHPVRWVNGEIQRLPGVGAATDINDAGDIVGLVNVGAGFHAVLWHQDRIVDLGAGMSANSDATAINNRGEISGETVTIDQYNSYIRGAVMWTADHTRVDLQPLVTPGVWTLEGALGINDGGQVLAWGALGSSVPRGALLSPVVHISIAPRLRNLRWYVRNQHFANPLRARLLGNLDQAIDRIVAHRRTAVCRSLRRFRSHVRDAESLTAAQRARMLGSQARTASLLHCGRRL
jgi:hypothetical protein